MMYEVLGRIARSAAVCGSCRTREMHNAELWTCPTNAAECSKGWEALARSSGPACATTGLR